MRVILAAALAGTLAAPPAAIVIVTPRGESVVPVTVERGVTAIAAPRLVNPLGLVTRLEYTWAWVTLGGVEFAFDLNTPFVRVGDSLYPLMGSPYLVRDTLFLPLQWLVETVPRALGTRYRWIPTAARFEEALGATTAALLAPRRDSAVVSVTPAAAAPAAPRPAVATGLRGTYTVVVDPGHGGRDAGNPGMFLPQGKTEKDVVLAIGKALRAELIRRGIGVRLTRTTDTLIDLADRGPMCRNDCDLFVSIHLNSMPPGRRQRQPRGAETYFLSDAKSEDQRRVAQMENDAIRFETSARFDTTDAIRMILRSLQDNEYLRESARLAALVQGKVAAIHPGPDRGVQQAGLMVLSTAGRPAILFEAGFATNREDGEFLGSALGQRKIATALADGVVAYLLEYERKAGSTTAGGPAR